MDVRDKISRGDALGRGYAAIHSRASPLGSATSIGALPSSSTFLSYEASPPKRTASRGNAPAGLPAAQPPMRTSIFGPVPSVMSAIGSQSDGAGARVPDRSARASAPVGARAGSEHGGSSGSARGAVYHEPTHREAILPRQQPSSDSGFDSAGGGVSHDVYSGGEPTAATGSRGRVAGIPTPAPVPSTRIVSRTLSSATSSMVSGGNASRTGGERSMPAATASRSNRYPSGDDGEEGVPEWGRITTGTATSTARRSSRGDPLSLYESRAGMTGSLPPLATATAQTRESSFLPTRTGSAAAPRPSPPIDPLYDTPQDIRSLARVSSQDGSPHTAMPDSAVRASRIPIPTARAKSASATARPPSGLRRPTVNPDAPPKPVALNTAVNSASGRSSAYSPMNSSDSMPQQPARKPAERPAPDPERNPTNAGSSYPTSATSMGVAHLPSSQARAGLEFSQALTEPSRPRHSREGSAPSHQSSGFTVPDAGAGVSAATAPTARYVTSAAPALPVQAPSRPLARAQSQAYPVSYPPRAPPSPHSDEYSDGGSSRSSSPKYTTSSTRMPMRTLAAASRAPAHSTTTAGMTSDPSYGAASGVTASAYSGSPRGLTGLQNLGNTCFMNSCLQCLSNIPPLTHYFVSGAYRSDLNRSGTARGEAALAFADLLQRMWRPGASGSVERPSRVKQIVGVVASRFLGYDQQDAQEFLRFFLDALHDDTNRITRKPPYVELDDHVGSPDAAISDVWWRNYCDRNSSVCQELFSGQLKTVVTCTACGKASRAFDPIWDMSIPIPKAVQMRDKFTSSSSRLASSSEPTSASLHDCLQAFIDPETLSGAEEMYCSRCKAHRSVVKQMTIFRPPRVLVLQLKRFTFSAFRRTKLMTSIDFPITGLDLRPYCSPTSPHARDTLYDCVGVSNHHGSLGGGHYNADCLNADDGKWYHFNDSHVSPTSASRLSSTAAYLLFYLRRDVATTFASSRL